MRSIETDIALTRDYIINHLHTSLTVCGLSAMFSMADSTLRRHFYLQYKISIHRFILQQRMEMAMLLVKQRHHPINEIATKVGYHELSNFSHAFKKYFGVSPSTISKFQMQSSN